MIKIGCDAGYGLSIDTHGGNMTGKPLDWAYGTQSGPRGFTGGLAVRDCDNCRKLQNVLE
jgi:hypothetical protein